jgi:hypothetical protein
MLARVDHCRGITMTIVLEPDLEAAVREVARRQGVAPEEVALDALRRQLLLRAPVIEPQDEWERNLLALTRNCGVSLSDSALSREEMYE